MGLDEGKGGSAVGLTEKDIIGDILEDGILDMISDGAGSQDAPEAEKPEKNPRTEPDFSPESYFESNTLEDVSTLKDTDLVMVSVKGEGGYQAKFVRLGDLKRFFTKN